jgi:hypothetical protein
MLSLEWWQGEGGGRIEKQTYKKQIYIYKHSKTSKNI